MLPSPDILNDYPYGKFVLSNLAAKRARQLREGALPLVQIDSRHELTIALAEIAAGKIRPILPEKGEALHAADYDVITAEGVTAERGILIPGLDEGDSITIGEEDEIEDMTDDGILSLADLVDEEGEDEVEEVASDDDTLSLQDIADQETVEEEGEEEEA
ncbi:hypothetical protein BH11ARM2_BH11ARM2_12370 [soil metagenome]